MEGHKHLDKKLPAKCKQVVDLKKMLQIVEGQFNTQEINSAFDYDYDIVTSSEDESVISRISSSDESENCSENEDILVIPPTPKKRKMNECVRIDNSKIFTTCTKSLHQYVQGTSGSNQSNTSTCDLSAQPSLNTFTTDNTSRYQVTSHLDPTVEHDEVLFIPLDTEVTPEMHHHRRIYFSTSTQSTFWTKNNHTSNTNYSRLSFSIQITTSTM